MEDRPEWALLRQKAGVAHPVAFERGEALGGDGVRTAWVERDDKGDCWLVVRVKAIRDGDYDRQVVVDHKLLYGSEVALRATLSPQGVPTAASYAAARHVLRMQTSSVQMPDEPKRTAGVSTMTYTDWRMLPADELPTG